MTPASYYDFHQPTDFLVDLNDHQDQALLPLCHDLHNHSNDQVSLKLVLSSSSSYSSSSSSLSSSPPPPSSCPNFFSPCPDQGLYNNHFQRTLPYPQEVDNYVGCTYRSYGQQAFPVEEKTETGLKFTIFKEGLEKGSSTATNEHQQGDHQTSSNPFKWMSSKTRIMRKMMKSSHQINVAAATAATPESTTTSMAAKHHHHGDQEDRKQPSLSSIENDSSSRSRPSGKNNFSPNHNDSSNNDALIRVCADCNTTKTPLWRSGPNGPKSLCNACGIRQRKARRALAAAQAAAAAANGSTTTTTTNLSAASSQKLKTSAELYHNKDKRLSPPSNGFVAQQKKRSKISNNNNNNRPGSTSRNSSSLSRGDDDQSRKLCFEEFAIDLSNKLSLDRVFPQEEKEAAILLMALSSGALVHG